ncbi:hypothetical protein D3C80_1959380 [compost metagenome]
MDAVQARHQFGEQGFIRAAVAEILADRLDQGLALVTQQVAQGFEPLLALSRRWHRVGRVCQTLGGKQVVKFAQGLLGVLQVGNVGGHGGSDYC